MLFLLLRGFLLTVDARFEVGVLAPEEFRWKIFVGKDLEFVYGATLGTIDKPEKYRTWIMRQQLWSQRKTHWAKMICCGGTLTVKCQPRESKRLKWRYMREDIESSRRGESSDIREEGCTIVDQCSKDGVWPRAAVQHLFVEGLSRKTQTRTACMQVEDQGSPS